MSAMQLAGYIFFPFVLGAGVMAIDPSLSPRVLKMVLGNEVLGALLLGATLLTLGIGLLFRDERGLRAFRRSQPKAVLALIAAASFLLGTAIAGYCCGSGGIVTEAILFSGYFAVIAAIVTYLFREAATSEAPLPKPDRVMSEKTRRFLLAGFVIAAGIANFVLAFRNLPPCNALG